MPKPPRAARPTTLSVTEIEHWLRDPYTIYAKHILRLAQLDRVDEPPGAADRGSAIHAAIAEFAKTYADRLPEQAERLAQHAFRGEVWDKAVAYGRQAGTRAFARSALREAVACF